MRFISLFAGIGGLDLGFERAGMYCVAQVEINPFCKKILAKHWPHVPRYGDIRDVGKHNLPEADLICGGFPCQPHSLAGGRKASIDDRDLWPEFARIVRECQPRWVVAENVSGLLSSEAGRFFGRVLADLAASGYCIEWQSLPAAAFGAPHIRERVFIIAHHEGSGEGQVSISTWRSQQENIDADGICGALPNTNHTGRETSRPAMSQEREAPYTMFRECGQYFEQYEGWKVEPAVGRVANGVPGRVDRLRGLGNAVVPLVAEFIARSILLAESAKQ